MPDLKHWIPAFFRNGKTELFSTKAINDCNNDGKQNMMQRARNAVSMDDLSGLKG